MEANEKVSVLLKQVESQHVEIADLRKQLTAEQAKNKGLVEAIVKAQYHLNEDLCNHPVKSPHWYYYTGIIMSLAQALSGDKGEAGCEYLNPALEGHPCENCTNVIYDALAADECGGGSRIMRCRKGYWENSPEELASAEPKTAWVDCEDLALPAENNLNRKESE